MKKISLLILISFSLFLFGCEQSVDQVEFENEQNNAVAGDYNNYSISTQEKNGDNENSTPKSGGTLRLSMRMPKTLNPLINEDVTVDKALKLIFEPLFKIDETGKVVSNIADSYAINNDILTVNLKSGLSWHNGSPITAKDVIFSINTIKAQGDKSLYKDSVANISSVIDNGNSLTIKLSKAYYYNIRNLSFPIIPSNYYDGKLALDSDVSFKPMGSGSFKFSSYQLAHSLNLEKCNGVNGSPYIDNVSVIITDDRQTDLYAFEQSITDVVQSDISEWGKYNVGKNINITEFNTNNFEFLGYNFKNAMLANIVIRQAISHAVPISEIFESVYLKHGVESYLPINPNSWFYAKDSLKPPKYSIEEASSIIEKSGYKKENLTFSILVNSDNKSRCEAATMIADRLNQIGFNITVNRQPFETYKSMLASDNFDMFIGGVKFSNSGEISPFLSTIGITNGINYCNYSNPQMDELIAKTQNATSDDAFKTAQEELQKFIESQIPCTGLCFKYSAILTNSNINGEKHPVVDNIFNDIQKWYIN